MAARRLTGRHIAGSAGGARYTRSAILAHREFHPAGFRFLQTFQSRITSLRRGVESPYEASGCGRGSGRVVRFAGLCATRRRPWRILRFSRRFFGIPRRRILRIPWWRFLRISRRRLLGAQRPLIPRRHRRVQRKRSGIRSRQSRRSVPIWGEPRTIFRHRTKACRSWVRLWNQVHWPRIEACRPIKTHRSWICTS